MSRHKAASAFALAWWMMTMEATTISGAVQEPSADPVSSAPALANATVSKGSISASGEALVRVAPDRISLQFGLQRTGTQVPELTEKMAEDGRRFMEAIQKTGVAPHHIQTEALALDMEYNEESRPSSGVRAYTASRVYTVRLTTTTLVEAVMEAAFSEGGAVTMDGPVYGIENPRPLRDQARRLAIEAAREKADLLAMGVGKKVVRAVSITEGGNNLVGVYRSSSGRGGFYAQNAMQNTTQNIGNGPTNGGDEGLPLGQVGVGASVTVTFEME